MDSPELPLLDPPRSCDGRKLRRELTLIDGLSLVVGMTVGSGIFTTAGVVLNQAGSVGECLVVWVAAAGVALCSVLLYAELGTSIPIASGEAEFYRAAFGPSWSFAFIWTSFLVLMPGVISVIVTSLAQYFVAAIGDADDGVTAQGLYYGDELPVKIVAITSVVAITIWNCARDVHFGARLQILLSLCKASLVVLLMMVAAVFLMRGATVLRTNFSEPLRGSSLSGFGPGLVAALWAFCGANNIVFLTEELKNPGKDLPLVSCGGIFIVICIYLVVNFSYLSVLPSSDIKMSLIVAMDTVKALLGHQAGRFTAILVAISMLANVNGAILCGGRYLYSAARDGHISGLRWLGKLSQRTDAPSHALIAQAVWCVLLLLQSSDLVKRLNYFSVAIYFFSGLTAVAHWKLRYQLPNLPRPFRVPLHPCVNIVVICSSSCMIVSSVLADPFPTIASLSLVLSSFPVYYVFVKKKDTETAMEN